MFAIVVDDRPIPDAAGPFDSQDAAEESLRANGWKHTNNKYRIWRKDGVTATIRQMRGLETIWENLFGGRKPQ